MWRALGLALVACLLLPAPAHALPWEPDLTYALERWERVVGYVPCDGDVEVRAHRFRNSALAHAHDCAVHWNADKLKRIQRDDRAHPGWICTLRAHEVGHLAGRGHSDNPRSIMAPVQTRVYERWC